MQQNGRERRGSLFPGHPVFRRPFLNKLLIFRIGRALGGGHSGQRAVIGRPLPGHPAGNAARGLAAGRGRRRDRAAGTGGAGRSSRVPAHAASRHSRGEFPGEILDPIMPHFLAFSFGPGYSNAKRTDTGRGRQPPGAFGNRPKNRAWPWHSSSPARLPPRGKAKRKTPQSLSFTGSSAGADEGT